MSKTPQVIKAAGQKEDFSQYKLVHNLNQAGVEKTEEQEILEIIDTHVKKNTISSKKIHQLTLQYLQKTDPGSAARYNLRQAVMELGPTGYPFEQYVSRILKELDYKVQTNKMIYGSCAKHEVDIVAIKKNVRYMIECKYHNTRGARSDLKTALYVWARFEDISQAWNNSKKVDEKFHEGWLVTNTKVTTDAEDYSKCRGLYVISWYRPYHHSLKDMIIKTGLWPITCLPTLSTEDKKTLIENKIVVCKDLVSYTKHQLNKFQISNLSTILLEAQTICKS